nr:hypothetical protein [Escherichia coli]
MNAQIKKLTQAFPAFRLRLADNKRWALMAGVGLAVAATAIIVSVLWTGNRGYVSLYGRQENLPVSQIVTALDVDPGGIVQQRGQLRGLLRL